MSYLLKIATECYEADKAKKNSLQNRAESSVLKRISTNTLGKGKLGLGAGVLSAGGFIKSKLTSNT